MRPMLAANLLAVLLCASCGKPAVELSIPFIVEFAGQDINCNSDSDTWLTDLRFYVADISVLDGDGNLTPVRLHRDEIWQQEKITLIDLEHGGANCINGTGGVNQILRGAVPAGDYKGLQFTLGVPFDFNHRDPLLAEAPLDDAAMHWHWRGGYKFLRAGIGNAGDSFWIHLGSTGCAGTIQNITGCTAPNRVTVTLNDIAPRQAAVVIDLAGLIKPGELADGTATDCSSGPAEEHCATAFAAFGIDHASGKQVGKQTIFSGRRFP